MRKRGVVAEQAPSTPPTAAAKCDDNDSPPEANSPELLEREDARVPAWARGGNKYIHRG